MHSLAIILSKLILQLLFLGYLLGVSIWFSIVSAKNEEDIKYQRVLFATLLYMLFYISFLILGLKFNVLKSTSSELLGWVWYFIQITSYNIFILRIFVLKKNKNKDSYKARVQKVFNSSWNDPKYFSLKDFWARDFFFDKKSWKSYLDFYYLCLFSFSTLLTTRFYFLVFLLFFYCIFTSNFELYIIFLIVVFFLTFLAKSRKYTSYINTKYGPNTIKKIGWNGYEGAGKKALVPAIIAAVANHPELNPALRIVNEYCFDNSCAHYEKEIHKRAAFRSLCEKKNEPYVVTPLVIPQIKDFIHRSATDLLFGDRDKEAQAKVAKMIKDIFKKPGSSN